MRGAMQNLFPVGQTFLSAVQNLPDDQFASRPRRRAFSFIDLIVVVVLIALLVALWLPTVGKARERASRQRCMQHLYMISQAINNYRGTYQEFPRTTYVAGALIDVSGAGAAAPDPFLKGGPPPNNVPAAFFLLVRTDAIDPGYLICPAGNFAPEPSDATDPGARSNFTDVRRNMGYSFAVPYVKNFGQNGRGGVALAADVNPGVAGPNGDDVLVAPNAPPDQVRRANSNSHKKRGQNVLFDDGRVVWTTHPFVGVDGDNIYTTTRGKVIDAPDGPSDSIVLPTDD
jgi:type II secretory pathway pseudopilin PulG